MTAPGATPTPGGWDGHPELELLAEFDAGALEPAVAARLGAHVGSCAPCQASLADLAAVSSLLAAAPRETIPATVADRIRGALAELPPLSRLELDAATRAFPAPAPAPAAGAPAGAPAGTAAGTAAVADLATARRRRGRRWALSAAAAVVLLAGASATAVLTLRQPAGQLAAPNSEAAPRSDTATQSRTAAAGSPPPPGLTAAAAGPPAFTRQTITRVPILAQILNGGGRTTASGSDGLSGPMANSELREACEAGIGAAVPGLVAPPLAVQYVTFEGTPAFVFVYSTGGTHRELVVVGAACSASDAHLLYRVPVA